jgi:transcriptional regulator with XRE-family HTH domain
MALKDVFIRNLKKIRKEKHISQMKLADLCGTAASYIGEIEIGRKFPSVKMIEKIAKALRIEAHFLFVDESTISADNEKTAAYFANLPPESRQYLLDSIMNVINDGLLKTLSPENEPAPVLKNSLLKKKGDRR